MPYLQLGQLSQLLGGVKDELSALEETERERRRDRREAEHEKRRAVSLS